MASETQSALRKTSPTHHGGETSNHKCDVSKADHNDTMIYRDPGLTTRGEKAVVEEHQRKLSEKNVENIVTVSQRQHDHLCDLDSSACSLILPFASQPDHFIRNRHGSYIPSIPSNHHGQQRARLYSLQILSCPSSPTQTHSHSFSICN